MGWESLLLSKGFLEGAAIPEPAKSFIALVTASQVERAVDRGTSVSKMLRLVYMTNQIVARYNKAGSHVHRLQRVRCNCSLGARFARSSEAGSFAQGRTADANT
ncbi:hypothetical protein BS78_07G214100 [Paspalum vaginatum]|nr:hypothetical protein BS78_07G214100 [Paspalum vaginatum]